MKAPRPRRKLDNIDLERIEVLARSPGYEIVRESIELERDRQTDLALKAPTWEETQVARARLETLAWVLQLPKQLSDEIRQKRAQM